MVNERDEIGSDLVPDYLTSVKEGGFYGWPYSYFGKHVDTRVKPPAPGPRRKGDRAGLRARQSRRAARLRVRGRRGAARDVPQRRLCRAAWVLELHAAERLQGDLRAVQGRKARRESRSMYSQASSTRTATLTAAPSASRWTRRARCWSPMMSAMSSGAWRRRTRRLPSETQSLRPRGAAFSVPAETIYSTTQPARSPG